MEHKNKLMATASCQGQGGCSEGKILLDRVSNLPDQVAHHILSFLTIEDLARFGCVSTRCRNLCLSTPSLDFDEFSIDNTSTCDERQRLLNCLDRFFFRRGHNKIQCFSLRWFSHYVDDNETPCFCDDEYFRMISWIHNAVNCDVEELDIQMTTAFEVDPLFPSFVFVCKSLRSLVVDIYCTLRKAPSFGFSSNLKYLELRHVNIEDEGLFKWISCCCKCIEGLLIREVHGIKNITIESSSLESFSLVGEQWIDSLNISGEKLEDILIDWGFHSPSKKSLNISAPNLKYLKWSGDLMNHPNLGKLECLEEAEIFLEPKVDDFDNVFEVLRSLCRVRVLDLNEATIKAAFREGSMPAPFDDVCYLCMDIGSLVDELVPSVVSLLRGMPNLCTLYIECNPLLHDPKTFGFNMGYWKLQNLAFIYQLKEVTIVLSNGFNGVELARYMLEYAPNLEKMVIIYLPQQSIVIKMLDKSRMNSNATVVFSQVNEGGATKQGGLRWQV